MLKVGLTGGIGCGKSTVSALFEKLDIPVIDADIIAHQLVEIGQPTLSILTQKFGTDILSTDGSLNRHELSKKIFSSAKKKQQLEDILHPLIYAQINLELLKLNTAYCIISIPLLIETAKTEFVDRILVIDCSIKQQIARVQQRDKLAEAQIHSIINAQASRKDRLAAADDVIENSKTALQLAQQVKKLHNSYLSLSTA